MLAALFSEKKFLIRNKLSNARISKTNKNNHDYLICRFIL